MKKLTAQMLREAGAWPDCPDMIAFEEEWPDGAAVTKKNMDRALELGLTVSWLETLLTGDVSAECKKATAPAWAECKKARASALAEYRRATAPVLLKALKKM